MSDLRPVTLSPATKQKLLSVSTATLTSQLINAGFRNTFLTGVYPLAPGSRMVGYAVTLRFVPAREDLVATSKAPRDSQQRLAIEAVGPEDVLVVEARGELRGAIIGDILAMKMKMTGGAGVVTDGAFRDSPACAALEWPIYLSGVNANRSNLYHYPAGRNEIISCAGVAICPGDIIVGDGEGVVAIPPQIAVQIADAAYEQELREQYIMELVSAGAGTIDIYPPNEATLAAFQQWRQAKGL
ncbi:MAG: ribonuclease activity regulator RraA [Ardenticatenales bacterium]|nr:ribonuclease activity regulator RraA [Ardenticatenales bacterium]